MRNFKLIWPFGIARLAFVACSATLLLAGWGCGSNGSAELPSKDVARTALERALNSWRTGGKPGGIEGTDPVVQVTDTPWSQGDQLGAYEIVKEDTSGAEKKFTVRLSLTKPVRVEEVQYHVMGRGPVMVFRDQDYMRNVNMEDGPKTSNPGAQKTFKRR